MEDNSQHKEQKTIGTFMIAAMWILLLVLLAYFFEGVMNKKMNPNQEVNTVYTADSTREVTLQRNRRGHYVTSGQINGREVTFMLDTGATGVAVPEHIASELNMKRGPGIELHTANGNAIGYMSTIDNIGIGGIELKGVGAIINPNDKSDVILLGMSFLQQVEFTQRGNELILRQYGGY